MAEPVATTVVIRGEAGGGQIQLAPDTLAEVIALLAYDQGEIGLSQPDAAFELVITGGKGEMRWSMRRFGKTRKERMNGGRG